MRKFCREVVNNYPSLFDRRGVAERSTSSILAIDVIAPFILLWFNYSHWHKAKCNMTVEGQRFWKSGI